MHLGLRLTNSATWLCCGLLLSSYHKTTHFLMGSSIRCFTNQHFGSITASDPGAARTRDPYIKSVLLYQLSYGIIFTSMSKNFVVLPTQWPKDRTVFTSVQLFGYFFFVTTLKQKTRLWGPGFCSLVVTLRLLHPAYIGPSFSMLCTGSVHDALYVKQCLIVI